MEICAVEMLIVIVKPCLHCVILSIMHFRFVTCPPEVMDEVRGPPRKLPRIFIDEEDGLKEFFLVVYQVLILHCFRFRAPPSLGKVGCQFSFQI